MRRHIECRGVIAGLRLFEIRVGAIKAVARTIGAVERVGDHRNVAEQERIGFDQHRFFLRMRRAGERGSGEQTVAGAFRRGNRNRRRGLGVVAEIFGDQLDVVANFLERDDVAAKHAARGGGGSVTHHAACHVGLQVIELVELLGLEFDPDFFVLGPQREQAWLLLRVLDDFRERARRTGGGGGRATGWSGCGGWRSGGGRSCHRGTGGRRRGRANRCA